MIPVGQQNDMSSQHKGIGKKLVTYAEWVAWYNNCDGVAIISGEGVKGYYEKKLNYHENSTYMVKEFKIKLFNLKDLIQGFTILIIIQKVLFIINKLIYGNF